MWYKKVGSQKYFSVSACMETPDGHVEHILQLSGGRNSETTLQNACVHVTFFLVLWSVLPSTGLALRFSIVLCMTAVIYSVVP